MSETKQKQFLIVAVTRTFLERGVLWFQENEAKIVRAAKTQSWWKKHALALEQDQHWNLSKFLRTLADLGYQKSRLILSSGEFSAAGDTIRVSPVNRDDILRIEFHGNTIESLAVEPFQERLEKKFTRKPAHLFREGEYVAHLDHGVGIWRGFENEYHVIEYAKPRPGSPPDRLLVPRSQEKKLSLYIGFEHPTIHRLGGQLWPRTKRKIKASAEAFARELLAIYAEREAAIRSPLAGEAIIEREFADVFPYVETPSQSQAIREILADMEKTNPMDRVLVGDVGFGKTEVAMRAALRAVLSGKQVAVLAPTTILAEQHLRTFRERFQGFPVAIAMLSRLTTPEEEKEILGRLRAGAVDVVIGTHRLLSKDVSIPQLGLLIIDEEQKFGVVHKEHFKKLRAHLDTLSLSATPIPRTLSLALASLRGVSQINDPPPERLAVKNSVLPWSEDLVREVIKAETERDGQVYILHNRVETIGTFAQNIKELAPQAAVGVIHGRMPENSLIKELDRFREKKTNVLVATTIIENGLDFSNVNTLIIENATRLGLSQAYQIRGRIGRGARQAYAYFLYPAQHLTDAARERLETLEAFEALGSGYEIALRDLEMRGAGAILGREQSGAAGLGGLNLYCQLLAEALESLQQKHIDNSLTLG